MKSIVAKYWLPCIYFFLGACYIAIIMYANRWIFTALYDASYWQDRYNSSQWVLPVSTRVIGDEGLYLHVGTLLAQGKDPTSINAEAPPLGKYLIGYTTQITNRPYVYGLIVYLAILLVFFLLANELFLNIPISIFSTLLLASDPLLISQITISMLDSTLLLFLLLFFVGLIRFKKNNSVYGIILAGMALGCFAATKFPSQAFLLILPTFIILRNKKLGYGALFVFSSILCYLLSYIQFFRLHPSIIDFLKIQKWMVNFYFQSQLHPNIGSVFTTLLVNKQQDLVTRTWVSSSLWSPLWSITLLLFLWYVFFFKKRTIPSILQPFIFFLSIGLIFYSYIPFWTRYLLILIPFLTLFYVEIITKQLKKTSMYIILGVSISIQIVASLAVIFPTPEADFRQLVYDWNNGFFQDVYERILPTDKTHSREEFYVTGKSIFSKATIEAAHVSIPPIRWSRYASPQTIHTTATYYTDQLGSYTVPIDITAKKFLGKWNFLWNWEYLGKGVGPTSQFSLSVTPATRGTIYDSNSKILAEDIPGYVVMVIPKLLPEEQVEPFLRTLELCTKYKLDDRVSYFNAQNRLKVYGTSTIPVTIVTIPNRDSDKDNQAIIAKLRMFPGVSLVPSTTRWYKDQHDTTIGNVSNQLLKKQSLYIYSTNLYNGTMGIEKQFNSQLQGFNGGTLTVINQNHETFTLIRTIKKDGQSLTLPRK